MERNESIFSAATKISGEIEEGLILAEIDGFKFSGLAEIDGFNFGGNWRGTNFGGIKADYGLILAEIVMD